MIAKLYRGYVFELNPDTGLFLVGTTQEDSPKWMKCREGFTASIGQYVLITPTENGYEIVRDDPLITETKDDPSISALPN